MPPNTSGGQYSGNNMIDMFRTQLMTMTMFSSMNGNKNTGTTGQVATEEWTTTLTDIKTFTTS